MDDDAKRLKKNWQAEQKAAARRAFPLAEDVLTALFRDIEAEVMNVGCDHSLCLTEKWLSDRNIEPSSVVDWLEENGGYCDCEVVANAGDHFARNRE